MVVNQTANSLYALIADGQHRATSLGRDTWKKLIGLEASSQHICNKEGFNAVCNVTLTRNNEDNCQNCDSRIGFGTGGYPYDSLKCGNTAMRSSDNDDKHIKAMGYILVH